MSVRSEKCFLDRRRVFNAIRRGLIALEKVYEVIRA